MEEEEWIYTYTVKCTRFVVMSIVGCIMKLTLDTQVEAKIDRG